MNSSPSRPFNILSIDGGGIRGVFPAKFLASLEEKLTELGYEKKQLFQHFDLICGTSTGGIIAIALALGIPANEILNLYLNNSKKIFGRSRWQQWLTHSTYDRSNLESIVKSTFAKYYNNIDPRIADCKTSICIPIYDLFEGRPSVLKTGHHPRYDRDYHLKAYQAALATSAAPTYFDPYSGAYQKINSDTIENFSNKIDGGVVANNPTLIGIFEAQKAFGKSLSEIQVLSIGTGSQKYSDANTRERWGKWYWMQPLKRRIIELFMQSQAQHVSDMVSLLQKGVCKSEKEIFKYTRIDLELTSDFNINLDESSIVKLNKLAEKAKTKFHDNSDLIINTYCSLNGQG